MLIDGCRDSNYIQRIYLRDLAQGSTQIVSRDTTGAVLSGHAQFLDLSADGNSIAYRGREGTNRFDTLFVFDAARDRVTVENYNESGAFSGFTSAVFSPDGKWLVVNRGASLFYRDLQAKRSYGIGLAVSSHGVSSSGRWLFTERSGGSSPDLYQFDGQTNRFWPPPGNGSFRIIGRYSPSSFAADESLFVAAATNFGSATLSLWLVAPDTGARTLVHTNYLDSASISADGRRVFFRACEAAGETAFTTNLFAFDVAAGSSARLLDSPIPLRLPQVPAISRDGRFVALVSSNALNSGGPSSFAQLYLFDSVLTNLSLISTNLSGQPGNGPSGLACLSADGRTMVFASHASDLLAADFNRAADLFLLRVPIVDANANSIDDGWEALYPGAAEPGADPDRDGAPNAFEYLAGTNPADPTSLLGLLSVRPGGETLAVACATVRGRRYEIQSTERLDAPDWKPVGLPFLALSSVTAAAVPMEVPARFLRLRLLE